MSLSSKRLDRAFMGHSNGGDADILVRSLHPYFWKVISQVPKISRHPCLMGNGTEIRFWKDLWCDGILVNLLVLNS